MRRYFGSAAHLIVSDSCRFHIATSINDRFLVSTIGEYVQPGKNTPDYTTVGCNRLYETMVFTTTGTTCDCGCGLPSPDSWSEIDFRGYNSAADANAGHEMMCAEYEARDTTVNEPLIAAEE